MYMLNNKKKNLGTDGGNPTKNWILEWPVTLRLICKIVGLKISTTHFFQTFLFTPILHIWTVFIKPFGPCLQNSVQVDSSVLNPNLVGRRLTSFGYRGAIVRMNLSYKIKMYEIRFEQINNPYLNYVSKSPSIFVCRLSKIV